MSATDTRLLLLGAVEIFGPVNGYQIRRELLSWEVDQWARINPGSIYGGLSTLSKSGLLRRTNLRDGDRDVAVYEVTDEGRHELRTKIIDALCDADPFDRGAFAVGFALLPLITKREALDSLRLREADLKRRLKDLADAQEHNAPPHARRGHGMWLDLARAELDWLRETIDDIASGELATTYDQSTWQPDDNDPGWQMVRDRERYRSLMSE